MTHLRRTISSLALIAAMPQQALERVARSDLPAGLREVSGLALVRDGTVLAHNDSRGIVVEIDYRTGKVVKDFTVGSPEIRGDFEGIAIAGNRIFLLESTGVLYEFSEGAKSSHVEYKKHDTGLSTECEFEGLAYEASTRSLLLACKNILNTQRKAGVLVFRWKIDGSSAAAPLEISLHEGKGKTSKGLRPSDITIDPATGDYILISSQDDVILDATRDGRVVAVRDMPSGHKQPEGSAITKDGMLILADEGKTSTPGVISVYRWARK